MLIDYRVDKKCQLLSWDDTGRLAGVLYIFRGAWSHPGEQATWMSPIPPSQHGALDRMSECRAATGGRIWLCLYEADERDGSMPPPNLRLLPVSRERRPASVHPSMYFSRTTSMPHRAWFSTMARKSTVLKVCITRKRPMPPVVSGESMRRNLL